jgi:hypothetical protein
MDGEDRDGDLSRGLRGSDRGGNVALRRVNVLEQARQGLPSGHVPPTVEHSTPVGGVTEHVPFVVESAESLAVL